MKYIKLILIIILSLCCVMSPVSKAGDLFLSKNNKQNEEIVPTPEATELTTNKTTKTETQINETEESVISSEIKKTNVTTTSNESKEKPSRKIVNNKSYSNDDIAGTYDWQYTKNAKYPINYKDSGMSIKIDKIWYRHAWCYVAQVKMSDYTSMRSVCANGKFGNGTETCLQAAKRTGAVLAVNACHSNKEQNIPVVRDGKVCNMGWASCNFPACYNKYTGKLGSTYDMGLSCVLLDDAVSEKKLTDGFCFGPEFDMINLQNNDDGKGGGRAQRTFIGTNGNSGNITIVVSEGRYVDNVSAGLTYKECAEVLKHYGCSFGVPLDGGGSSTMVYKNQILNHLPSERKLVDFVIFK